MSSTVEPAMHEPGMQLALNPEEERRQLLRERAHDGLVDLWVGLVNWRLWALIAWFEVKQRYRRSLIGPFWITLSIAMFVIGLGIVYAGLFRVALREYLPFLATGVVVWTLVSTLVNDGCTAFTAAEGAIKQMPVPLSVHVYRMVARNVIIFAHNAVIYIPLAVFFDVDFGWMALLALPGLLLIAVNGVGFGLTLGIFSARFRDVPLMIQNLVQLIFFTTPIMWYPSTLPPERLWVAHLNPFFYLLESVRQPLLGHAVSAQDWLICLAFTLVNLAIGVVLYARYRARIAYWL